MASFQAKIGWERPRKRKIKVFFPFPSDQTGKRKFQKEIRKFKKIKKYHCSFISRQNRLENAEKEKKKKLPFRSLPIGLVIENSKKREENSKKSKSTIVASFQAKIGWKRLRERKEKLWFRFVPN